MSQYTGLPFTVEDSLLPADHANIQKEELP